MQLISMQSAWVVVLQYDLKRLPLLRDVKKCVTGGRPPYYNHRW